MGCHASPQLSQNEEPAAEDSHIQLLEILQISLAILDQRIAMLEQRFMPIEEPVTTHLEAIARMAQMVWK